MKKFYTYFAVLAAGLLSFSCAKEVEVSVETENTKGFEYVFRVVDENSDPTKTTIDGSTVKWEENDQIGVYAEGTTNKFGKITTLNPVQFPVYLTSALSAGDKVYCYYPYNKDANDSKAANEIVLTIPASQTGDFDAMPQVSIPYTTPADMASGSTNVADIRFCNIGAVARFLVYSSTGAYDGETVESIKFTANTGLAGSVSFDLTAVDYDDPSTLATTGYASLSATTTESPAIGTNTTNAGVANLVIAPGTYFGTVLLTTDVARYTYTIAEANKITFARSAIKNIGLNLESATCTRVEKHPVGEVFIPATSISAGDKILLASGTSGTVYVMGYQKSDNRNAVSCSADGAIISTADTYPLVVGTGSTEPSYFTLYDNDEGGYLYAAASSSNKLKTEESVSVNSEWEIVIDGTSKATTLAATGSSNRKVMQFNSGSSIFNCYSSASQSAVYVFKKSTDTFISAANQDIAYTVTSVEIPYNVYNGSGATTVTFNTNPGTCASNLAINEGTKKVTFDITANTGATRTVKVDITNNGITKTVSINQAAAPSKLVMSAITAVSSQNQIVFSWEAVANATGYQISTNDGTTYGSTQAATSYTWDELDPFTDYTIKVKAIADGIYHLDSDAGSLTAKTTLAVPTGLTWTKNTKTVTWTDPNTGVGTYGTAYKYQYTIDNGANFTDIASPGNTVTLTITESKTFKIKAVYITDATLNSALSDGLNCNVGDAHYYNKVTSITDGKKYLMVANGKIFNGASVSATTPGVDASVLTGDKILSTATVDTYAVTINGPASSKYTVKLSTDKYLIINSSTNSNSDLSSGKTGESITISYNSTNQTFRFISGNRSTRGIAWRDTASGFKNYAVSNFSSSGYCGDFVLYEYDN